MEKKLQSLPIGTYHFEKLRQRGHLYVDKTAPLVELINAGDWYFLSRPRRFGKSLTLSTLDAMFRGKAELFHGLAAEDWVAEQAAHPCPVLRLDMSMLDVRGVDEFEDSLMREMARMAEESEIEIKSTLPGGVLRDLIIGLYDAGGPVVVLIDEYDKPILDKIGDLEAAEAMRMALRSFYTVVKACDEYIRFLMIVGISVCPKCPTLRTDAADRHSAGRLSGARELAAWPKVGVFSAMNNLNDISMDRQYGDVVGYTQAELERNFAGWIDRAAEAMETTRAALLERMKDYYDGFCFDGRTRLYNPFSVMQCLQKARFANYWYGSGSPTFIVEYMKRHAVQEPEAYRGLSVKDDFAESQEIERSRPESFLFQAGYLTIREWEERALVLDYPNQEVLDSIASMYLEHVYRVEGYEGIGTSLWRSLRGGDLAEAVRLYNTALAGIPYEDFKAPSESFYRSLFLMLLRGAGMTAQGEAHTFLGRSDVLVRFPDRVAVLEFKLAQSAGEVERLRAEGQKQIEERGYAKPCDAENRPVTTGVVVVDAQRRQAAV